MFAAGLALVLLAGVTVMSVRRWLRTAAGTSWLPSLRRTGEVALTVVVAVLWLRLNSPLEGAVLVVVGPTNGLTLGDLLAAPALAAAVLRIWPRWSAVLRSALSRRAGGP